MRKSFKLLLGLLLAVLMVASVMTVGVFAEDAQSASVAKVGDTEYATIDEAIANWTNGTTLTLLADVTLSDVIKLSSTEYHILDLGTYTMTAAKNKDAIQYVVNGRSSASYALDIKADATNPGGITATGQTIVSHMKPSSNAPAKDRPITRFFGGVFNASYVVKQGGTNSWGFLTSGYTGASAPYFQFYGGEFNGTIYTNRSQNQFHGGTFNGNMQMSVDSSAYTQVAGGTFKNLSNSMGSTLNSDKFVIGTAKGANNGSVCIDENGYYVITTTTPTNAEASVVSSYNSNNYFYYSTVNTNGMYYEDVYDALEANPNGTITVYTDELDLEGSSFKGTIVVPEGKTLTIKNAPTDLKIEGEGEVVIEKPVAEVNGETFSDLQEAVNAAGAGDTIILLTDVTLTETLTIPADKTVVLNLNGKTISQEKACTAHYEMILNKGTLTITGEGKISFKDTGAGDPNFGWGSYTINNRGTLVVENGTIEHLGAQAFATHMICAIQQSAGSTTINGGVISTPAYRSVRINGGDLVINGGEFDGQVWLQPNQGGVTITVTGGTFGPNGRDGSSIFMTNKGERYTVTAATISGGVFTTKIGASDPAALSGAITGGSFSEAAKNGTNAALIGEDVKFGDVVNGYFDIVKKDYVAEIEGGKKYESLEEAFAAAENGDTITLLADIALSEMIVNKVNVTLDLNGKTITGTDTTSKNFSLIDNRGTLTITGNGTITLTATTNSGWNRYSAVIANNPGGKLIIENGTLEHLGGTDMAYGIDNLTNGKGTYAETVINGGTIKSTYRGIRQFLNGVEAQNILTINGGTIEGANKSVWMQDPNKNANSGSLTIGANASLKGDVYLFVTAGSTEWPVQVAINASALKDGSVVMTGNIPAGYGLANVGGTYGVFHGVAKIGNTYYETLAEAFK
ncbi:MAG: hypothetical protein E7645_02395, partial [Ruminococcaceae bacterium]|nr:hypothetical protein [Oscillospiraceae bacterium]